MKPITEEDLRTKHIAEIYDMMERRYETCVLLSARIRWWSVAIRTHRFRLHRVSLVKHEEAKADMLQRWKGGFLLGLPNLPYFEDGPLSR